MEEGTMWQMLRNHYVWSMLRNQHVWKTFAALFALAMLLQWGLAWIIGLMMIFQAVQVLLLGWLLLTVLVVSVYVAALLFLEDVATQLITAFGLLDVAAGSYIVTRYYQGDLGWAVATSTSVVCAVAATLSCMYVVVVVRVGRARARAAAEQS